MLCIYVVFECRVLVYEPSHGTLWAESWHTMSRVMAHYVLDSTLFKCGTWVGFTLYHLTWCIMQTYLRASPADLLLWSWCLIGTKYFRLTILVRRKWTTQLCWVTKLILHNFLPRTKSWSIWSSEKDFVHLYWTMSKMIASNLAVRKWTWIIDWVGRCVMMSWHTTWVGLTLYLLLLMSRVMAHYVLDPILRDMAQLVGTGWLRLVGSLKLKVSSAECRLFYTSILRKRPIILRSLLIAATPYDLVYVSLMYISRGIAH